MGVTSFRRCRFWGEGPRPGHRSVSQSCFRNHSGEISRQAPARGGLSSEYQKGQFVWALCSEIPQIKTLRCVCKWLVRNRQNRTAGREKTGQGGCKPREKHVTFRRCRSAACAKAAFPRAAVTLRAASVLATKISSRVKGIRL